MGRPVTGVLDDGESRRLIVARLATPSSPTLKAFDRPAVPEVKADTKIAFFESGST